MTSPASFLNNAKERLLPASVPFRYFIAASIFHILAWLTLVFAANDLPGFTGGPGLVLASLHLLTLGVLVMTAIGASFQLLPVATGQALIRQWPAKLCFWLFTPGTLLLTWGMIEASPAALHAGTACVGAGLLVYALLIADNLRRARSAMPVVTAHGWAALIAMLGFVVLGLLLVIDYKTGFLENRQIAVIIHMVLATFGFMGLLTFGFSHVLIPMFALSRSLSLSLSWLQLILAIIAIILAIIAILIQNDFLLATAILTGLGASTIYLWLMRTALSTGMRKRLGLSFVVIKISWAFLLLALLTGLAVMLQAPIKNGVTLFGFLLLVGWLLTFLTGVLQRIIPFLASMHVLDKDGRPPLLSDLTAERPLKIHAACHFAALIICSAGIILDTPIIIKLGAISGVIGALAFAAFTGFVASKLASENPDR